MEGERTASQRPTNARGCGIYRIPCKWFIGWCLLVNAPSAPRTNAFSVPVSLSGRAKLDAQLVPAWSPQNFRIQYNHQGQRCLLDFWNVCLQMMDSIFSGTHRSTETISMTAEISIEWHYSRDLIFTSAGLHNSLFEFEQPGNKMFKTKQWNFVCLLFGFISSYIALSMS